MFTNTGGTQQANNQPDLDGQPKMGEELKSQRSPRQGVLSSSSHKSELASVSSKWQIWTTLSLPFLAVLLQLVWEHRGGNSQLAEGPIVPLALAWLVPRHRLLPPPGVLLTLPLSYCRYLVTNYLCANAVLLYPNKMPALVRLACWLGLVGGR